MQLAASTPIRLEQTFTESEPHHVTLSVTWLHLRRIPEQFATRIGANMGSDSRCLHLPNQNPAHGAFAPSCRFAQDVDPICNARWRK